MMRHSGCRALVVSFCIAGCSFDFTDIPSDTPAHLSVNVVSSTQTDSLTVRAGLTPGRDTDTNIRAVLSELLVSGRAIPLVQVGDDGARLYQTGWSLSAHLPADTTLVLRAPDIEGLQSTSQTFTVSIPVRIGADTLFVGGDESVVLRVALATAPAAHRNWFVDVTDSNSVRSVDLSSAGRPPDEIIIPRSWLSSTRVQNARLRVTQRLSGELIPGEYNWQTLVDSYIHWTVILSDNE
jgi:hypothetical protein